MFLDGVPTDDGTLFAYWVTLAGLTGLVDGVTTGNESDDGTLFAYWVTLAGLTILLDDVTTDDGARVNWATPVG